MRLDADEYFQQAEQKVGGNVQQKQERVLRLACHVIE
jgi:hypothetical protein